MYWYTKSISDRDRVNGGGQIWLCPKCRYHPGEMELPQDRCSNCGFELKADGPGDGVTRIKVRRTRCGFSRVLREV